MRRIVGVVGLVAGLALAPSSAAAQETETLRRELQELQRQFEATKQQYQRTIDTLTERLQRLETRPQTSATGPALTQTPRPEMPSLVELTRPREPFALYERRGAGQLLFDFGIVADFVGNLTSSRVERDKAGTFTGRENRIFPREVELNLYGPPVPPDLDGPGRRLPRRLAGSVLGLPFPTRPSGLSSRAPCA